MLCYGMILSYFGRGDFFVLLTLKNFSGVIMFLCFSVSSKFFCLDVFVGIFLLLLLDKVYFSLRVILLSPRALLHA